MKTLEEIKKELANIFGYVEELSPREMERLGVEDIKRMKINNLEYRMVCRLLESTISQTKQELIDKVENKLYTENGFFREDDGVAPDVQGVLQDIKLEKLSNK